MFTRRSFLIAGLVLPGGARAHDGHDLSGLEAGVSAGSGADGGLELVLTLTNRRDASVELAAVYSDLGDVLGELPLRLGAGETGRADLSVKTRDWPGIFTLILDFGEAGQGPVTVIPM